MYRRFLILFFACLIFQLVLSAQVKGRSGDPNTLNADPVSGIICRMDVVVNTGFYNRKDTIVQLFLNSFPNLKQSDLHGNNSVCVIDKDKSIEVPSGYTMDKEDPNTAKVFWLLKGEYEPLVEKEYQILLMRQKESTSRPREFILTDPGIVGNLIPNGDFEKKDGGWQISKISAANQEIKISQEEFQSGHHSLKVKNDDVAVPGYDANSNIFAIEPGPKYLFSARFKIARIQRYEKGAAIGASLVFLDENRRERRPPQENNYRALLAILPYSELDNTSNIGRWIFKKLPVSVPAWARYGQVRLSLYYCWGEAYFDDIQFKRTKAEDVSVKIKQVEYFNEKLN